MLLAFGKYGFFYYIHTVPADFDPESSMLESQVSLLDSVWKNLYRSSGTKHMYPRLNAHGCQQHLTRKALEPTGI